MSEQSRHAEKHIDSIVKQEEEALERRSIWSVSPMVWEFSLGAFRSSFFIWRFDCVGAGE
jgi:hypothetical protein